jgi:hypothetical protein
MEAHNANTHLVQPNFHQGDFALRAVPKMRQHKLSLTWKGTYVVEQVYANHTLRLRSLIQDITFITHATRARIYRNIDHDLRQEMPAMKLAAEHNNCIPYVVAKLATSTSKSRRGTCSYGQNGSVLSRWKGRWSHCMRNGLTCRACSRNIYKPVPTMVANWRKKL